MRIREFCPLSIISLRVSAAVIRREVLHGIGGALPNNRGISALGLADVVGVSPELTQHVKSEFKTRDCRKRRWDPELGLVPESDIIALNNRPEKGRWSASSFSSSTPTKRQAVPKTGVVLSPHSLSPFAFYD